MPRVPSEAEIRDFIDAILTAIDTASLNDEEFELITIEEQVYTKALYTEVLVVLDSREAVSDTRDRLRYYFMAKGVDLSSDPIVDASNIYIGDDLCS